MKPNVLSRALTRKPRTRRESKKVRMARALPYILCMVFILSTCFLGAMPVFASDGSSLKGAKEAFDAIFKVVSIITSIVAILFILVGLVKFITAHANDNGPDQQKAAMMIATGVGLLVLAGLIGTLGINEKLIDTTGGGREGKSGFIINSLLLH